MKKNTRKIVLLITLVVIAVTAMALVDTLLKPGYIRKSAIKTAFFLLLPLIYSRFDRGTNIKGLFRFEKGSFLPAMAAGIGIYGLIVGGYFIAKNFFDFSQITSNLAGGEGVTKENFLPVALYVSFCNSLLEEIFFRGFAFLNIKRLCSPAVAYVFSSLTFALYHIAIMIGWYSLPVTALVIFGIFVGGLIFNKFDEKSGSVLPSWVVHILANFATNTIGFLLFA